MLATYSPTTRIHDLSQLRQGDTIEARSFDAIHYRGEVELVVPHLGVLWLRHGSWRHRKLLAHTDYDIWKIGAPTARHPRHPAGSMTTRPKA